MNLESAFEVCAWSLESGHGVWNPDLLFRLKNLESELSLESGLGVRTAWTPNLEAELGDWSPDLESGVCTWSVRMESRVQT